MPETPEDSSARGPSDRDDIVPYAEPEVSTINGPLDRVSVTDCRIIGGSGNQLNSLNSATQVTASIGCDLRNNFVDRTIDVELILKIQDFNGDNVGIAEKQIILEPRETVAVFIGWISVLDDNGPSYENGLRKVNNLSAGNYSMTAFVFGISVPGTYSPPTEIDILVT